jgi:16S rRNA (adenine1518-N6/adenine1519-N6)-dimethyltransferase
MSLYQQAKHLMRVYRVFPKKYLGQNFVVDKQFLQLMSSYASVGRSDVVLEVGAGFGFLTRLLAQKSRKVVAVEADARLVEALQNELSRFDNVELIEGSVLKVAIPPFDKVVSNPPFSISSPLLFWLLKRTFNRAVVTFQKEFVERLNAPVGSKDYGRLTISTYYHSEVEVLDSIPKEAFYPSPEVDVVIVRLKPKRLAPFRLEDEEVFDEVVQTLFTQRNRKVRNAVLPLLRKHGSEGTAAVKNADVLPFHNKRVRDLAPEDFGVLANELST